MKALSLAACLMLGMIVFALSPVPAQANTLTVNTLVDENDGSCVGSACSLRDAVVSAAAGDTIQFSVSGTILLTHGYISIQKNLTVYGPGSGVLTVNGNDADQIFYVQPNVTLNVSGLTLAHASGGAIYNSQGTVVAGDMVFTGSQEWSGGAIYSYDGTTTVTHCVVSGNINGSAVYVAGGTMSLTGCVFSGNSSMSGGAIYNSAGTLSVINCAFTNNYSEFSGGAIYNYGGPLTVSGSSFVQNHGDASAGGIYNSGTSTADVTNSTFSGNTSVQAGAAFYNDSGTLNLTNSTLVGNTAANGANAIYRAAGIVTVKNTLIAGPASGASCQGTLAAGSASNLSTDSTCSPGFTQKTAAQLALGALGGSPAFHPLLPGSAAIDAGTNAGCPATDQRGFRRPLPAGGKCDVGAIEYGRSYYWPWALK
jgi:CSLREA domain-containing protein